MLLHSRWLVGHSLARSHMILVANTLLLRSLDCFRLITLQSRVALVTGMMESQSSHSTLQSMLRRRGQMMDMVFKVWTCTKKDAVYDTAKYSVKAMMVNVSGQDREGSNGEIVESAWDQSSAT